MRFCLVFEVRSVTEPVMFFFSCVYSEEKNKRGRVLNIKCSQACKILCLVYGRYLIKLINCNNNKCMLFPPTGGCPSV